MPDVDVVVVSYNSRDQLRGCVEPFAGAEKIHIIVVDNASSDGSLERLAGLPVDAIALERNGGFAHGCNVGWRAGSGTYVLFLNPDARIDLSSLASLVGVLEQKPAVGAAAPRIIHADGTLDYSQRRFPRLRSTYAQALFLHRIFPQAAWTDELIRDSDAYGRRGSPDWVSGACLLLRREALVKLDGLDEGFFMYGEDIDLCRRLRDAGWEISYEPEAVARHEGGASAPRASLLPVLAASRVRYARKHRSPIGALLEQIGVALGAATHIVSARDGSVRAGHARALLSAASRSRMKS